LRSKRQHNGSNRLDIKPSGPHHKPVGKNLFFTCKAEVSNPSLVRDLKWLKPSGQNIPEDDRLEISKFRNFLYRLDLRRGHNKKAKIIIFAQNHLSKYLQNNLFK
jgi:hypothetical protein